jgi:hypothetical protein
MAKRPYVGTYVALLIKRQSDGTLVRMLCHFTYKSLIFLEINPKSTSYPPEPIPPLSPRGRRSRGDTAAAWPAPCPKASISLLVGGDREETRQPPGLRHAPRHQSVGSWSGTGSCSFQLRTWGASSRSSLYRGERGRRRWDRP